MNPFEKLSANELGLLYAPEALLLRKVFQQRVPCLCIVGDSGHGKSTRLKLLERALREQQRSYFSTYISEQDPHPPAPRSVDFYLLDEAQRIEVSELREWLRRVRPSQVLLTAHWALEVEADHYLIPPLDSRAMADWLSVRLGGEPEDGVPEWLLRKCGGNLERCRALCYEAVASEGRLTRDGLDSAWEVLFD